MSEADVKPILQYQGTAADVGIEPRGWGVIGFVLVMAVAGIALTMRWLGVSTWLEVIGFITGAWCVWLTVRENVWNFPISLLNVAVLSVVYFEVQLYADAGLQVVYFVLTAIGWYLWLFGGEDRTALRVMHASGLELAIVACVGIAIAVSLWQLLHYAGGSAPALDALTTALSLCAQWLLNRKRIENWFFWIAADLIYVPLYAYKGLYLTAGLYAVFLGMCVIGLVQWQAKRRPLEVTR